MEQAFTVRIRREGGAYRMGIAPAAGLGIGFTCCTEGHTTRDEAITCGTVALTSKLSSDVQTVAA
jgi:hypothetical protein